MEAARMELLGRHAAEMDKQARAAIGRISGLERSIADQALLHEQERARTSHDMGVLKAQFERKAAPEHPLVEVCAG
jgi:hypothetical protein